MMIHTVSAIEEFRNIVSRSDGHIWMQDSSGQEYDLKSELSMYRVIGRLLSASDHDLELYASDPNTQMRLISFLYRQKHQSA